MQKQKKSRNNYTAQEKAAILRRHLIDHIPVSDLCDEHHLQPTVFYRWQKLLFENAAAALESPGNSKKADAPLEKRIASLEEKLTRKNEVLAELMQEYIELKKELGEL
jgi:transposase-like protein